MKIVVTILSILVSLALGFLCVLYLGSAKMLLPVMLECILFFINFKYNKYFRQNPNKGLIIFWFTFIPFLMVPIIIYALALLGYRII